MNRSTASSIAYPAEVSTHVASVAHALGQTCDEARQLELILFAADRCSTAGLLVAQLHLLFTRLERGIAASRTDLLSVLAAASRMPPRGE